MLGTVTLLLLILLSSLSARPLTAWAFLNDTENIVWTSGKKTRK